MQVFLLAALLAGQTFAEAPLYDQAPYAAAGYRPSIPFDLPGEYYPAFDVETDPQFNNQGITLEITKQRVDFAGQEIQRVPISEPQNQYLPPERIVFVNNRVGNNNRGTRNFGRGHFHRRRNGNGRGDGNGCDQGAAERPQNNPPTQTSPPQNRPPQFPTNLPPVNVPLPRPSTDERFESQQFFPKNQQRPAAQYGAPYYNIDPRNSNQQNDAAFNAGKDNFGFTQPSLQYGPPSDGFESQHKPAPQYGAPAQAQSSSEEELEKQFALDALNAAVQHYNRLQENDIDKIAQGQYFVVNPDHSIQKVNFTTKKSDDITKQNDFTAELKYTKVGEINDPLYKYTAEGQLVRIVKK